MNQATLAWGAFKNMMRLARRDPIWAVSSIIMSPFRAGRYLLQVGLFILIVTMVLAVAANGIPHEWWIARGIAGLVILLVFVVLVFRVLTNPMITHFGDMEGETHGSARFANDKETAALARADSGLLIGLSLIHISEPTRPY